MKRKQLLNLYKTHAVELLKAIHAKCSNCMAGSWKEIKQCNSSDCALHPFREYKISKSATNLRTDFTYMLGKNDKGTED